MSQSLLYLAGFLLSLLVTACLDARGCKAINLKSRIAVGDREELTFIAIIACLVWPLTVGVLTLTGVYFLLVRVFSWRIREWRCSAIETRTYGDLRCYKQAHGSKAPMCPTHKVTMIDATVEDKS